MVIGIYSKNRKYKIEVLNMRNTELVYKNLTVKEARDYLKSKGVVKIPSSINYLAMAYDTYKRRG